MSEQKLISSIQRAARHRAKARQAQRQATDELRVACAQAKAAGVPISRIASEAELSRQGVYDLLTVEQPSA